MDLSETGNLGRSAEDSRCLHGNLLPSPRQGLLRALLHVLLHALLVMLCVLFHDFDH